MNKGVVAVVLVLALHACAWALVNAYHVDPVKAAWSGKVLGDPEFGGVSQLVTCNFDSLSYVELFAGDKGNPENEYLATVYENGDRVMQSPGTQSQDCDWVKFDNWDEHPAFTKGKVLECRFTRTGSGSDSINYYYRDDEPYAYGHLVPAGDQPPPSPDADLCMRVYGVMNLIDSLDFACVEASWWTPDTLYQFSRESLAVCTRDARVKSVRLDLDWHQVQYNGPDDWNFVMLDDMLRTLRDAVTGPGCAVVGLLSNVPEWASTRVDSIRVPRPSAPDTWLFRTSIQCAPRGLDSGVASDSNYLARFMQGVARHADSLGLSIHDWECWNEPNDGCTVSTPGVTGWFQHPNRYYIFDPTIDGMCSLYVRMGQVMAEAVRATSATHTSDRLAIGSMARVSDSWPNPLLYSGKSWLRTIYDVAARNHITPYWDAISVHPYHTGSYLFVPAKIEADAETLRCIMREHGDYGELWSTEFGMPGFSWWDTLNPQGVVNTEEQDANYFCQTFSTLAGSRALPGGGFDRDYWWYLRRPPHWGSWGLVDSLIERHKELYACRHTSEQLVGKRLNGRVLLGDARDDSVRIYEFENPADSGRRTWVGWANDEAGSSPGTPSIVTALPVRADENDTVALDYTGLGTMPTGRSAGQGGWLTTMLTTRPTFYTEPHAEPISRPDLIVDSIRVRPLWPMVGRACTLHAYVRNQFPIGMSGTPLVRFRWNGDTIPNALVPMDTTHDAWTVSHVIASVPTSMHGSGLFSADANPGQAFVELGMDDNVGYQKTTIRRPPEGDIEIASQDGRSNVPLIPVTLHSVSWERDTTGQTPTDSARLISWLLNKGDTVVAGDTTPWFSGAVTDTMLRFTLGEGRYRIFLQVADSGANRSDTISDAQHPVIVFDSTSATGTIEINSGARFTTTTACTLGLTASDAGSGVHAMRIGRAKPVQLLLNSGFGNASTHWEFSSACLDSGGLGMAVLKVTPDSASWVRQDIAADSVRPLLGDTVRLLADLLVSVPDTSGDTCGWLKLRYVYENHNSLVADSLVTVGSIGFTGGTQALCGLNCLSGAFKLTPLMTDTSWTWTAARVELTAGGPLAGTGTGVIYADNVQLTPSGPAPDYSWWTGFDSTQGCTLSTGAGERTVYALLQDSCGVETATPLSDGIILDALAPMAHISSPVNNGTVSGMVNVTGWAFDSVKVAGDTWFMVRRLQYKATNSSTWLPCAPDSMSHTPVYNTYSVGLLGHWSTLGISNGFYHLRIVAVDSAGNTTAHQITVKIQNGRSMAIFTGSGPSGGEVSLDATGSDFVGSATGKVVSLSDELDSLSGFTVTDSGTPAYVAGITELDSSHILVADARSGDVSKMTKTGTEKQELIPDLDLPVAVATDAGGNIWTLDKGTSQLTKHRPDGTLVLTIGGEGEDSTCLSSPEAVTIKGSLVYIADTRNNRVAVYDTAGTLVRLITGDFHSPCAVVVTDSGQLYLVDKQSGTIEGINELGGHLLTIVQEDSAPLRQLALSDDGRSLVTLKTGSNDILKYEVVCSDSGGGGIQSGGTVKLPTRFIANQPWPNPMRTRLFISYAIPKQQRVTVRIYDIAGKLQRVITDKDHRPGYYNQVWDRTDSHGREVSSGIYFIEVATPTDQSRKKVVLAK